jgi:hypothetical protein
VAVPLGAVELDSPTPADAVAVPLRIRNKRLASKYGDCGIRFTPLEIAADSAKVDVHVAQCGAKPEAHGTMTVTRDRISIPGTQAEVAIERVENTRLWPMPRTASFLHRDVTIDLYGAP